MNKAKVYAQIFNLYLQTSSPAINKTQSLGNDSSIDYGGMY